MVTHMMFVFLLDCIIISSSLLPSHDFLSHLFISLLKVLHHSMMFRYTSHQEYIRGKSRAFPDRPKVQYI